MSYGFTERQLQNFRDRIRAWSVTDKDGCWIWIGSKKYNRCGTAYARFTLRVPGDCFGKSIWTDDGPRIIKYPRVWSAHKVSYIAFKGEPEIRLNHVYAHSCDKPLCVNPECIEYVPQSKNIRDAIERGRWKSPHAARQTA